MAWLDECAGREGCKKYNFLRGCDEIKDARTLTQLYVQIYSGAEVFKTLRRDLVPLVQGNPIDFFRHERHFPIKSAIKLGYCNFYLSFTCNGLHLRYLQFYRITYFPCLNARYSENITAGPRRRIRSVEVNKAKT